MDSLGFSPSLLISQNVLTSPPQISSRNTPCASGMDIFPQTGGHRPDFGQLTVLVSAAVLEVVAVSFMGYLVAVIGLFNPKLQKDLATLNTHVFTPCLIFTKVASQLSVDRLPELAIIPILFVIMTAVSFGSARILSLIFRFNKRQRHFVTAMAVFGNSNSLPMSLVLSLSHTIHSLRWDKIPGDNAQEVAARGLLYLLVFQQLGQAVRWSWGLNVLLRPASQYTIEEGGVAGGVEEEQRPLLRNRDPSTDSLESSDGIKTPNANNLQTPWAGSGTATPLNREQYTSSSSTLHDLEAEPVVPAKRRQGVQFELPSDYDGDDDSEPDSSVPLVGTTPEPKGLKAMLESVKGFFATKARALGRAIANLFSRAFQALPAGLQTFLQKGWAKTRRFFAGVREFMNPPLYAMIVSIIVASVPVARSAFFTEGTFVNNSLTRAIDQCGRCAVPLILVCLGGNLYRSKEGQGEERPSEDSKSQGKLLFASLTARLVFPTILLAPVIAIFAKYVPVSILDDPIFVIVAFLLAGAPTALQLAQICQLNDTFMPVMARILMHSYVIWIFPSTFALVLLALEVVKWAG